MYAARQHELSRRRGFWEIPIGPMRNSCACCVLEQCSSLATGEPGLVTRGHRDVPSAPAHHQRPSHACLADWQRNNAKSDHLAAEDHLAAWIEQNREHAAEIDKRLADAALPHDFAATVRIAEWAYEQTERVSGQVWVAKDVFRHLGPEWRRVLVA